MIARLGLVALFLFAAAAHANRLQEEHAGLRREALKLEERIKNACGRGIRVDLGDYMFSYDEKHSYEYPGSEHCQVLIREIEEACKKHPDNQRKFSGVNTIACKRGSIGDRKMIKQKTGDLVYLAARDPREAKESKDALIREDLTRLFKIDFKADFKIEKEEKVKRQTKDAEEKLDAERAERQKANADETAKLTAWFQDEVRKITKTPGPAMSKKLELLQKQYEEKINAIHGTK